MFKAVSFVTSDLSANAINTNHIYERYRKTRKASQLIGQLT